MNRLCVTLITKNEERNLPRLLASLEDLADELVVVDSGSTDATLPIAMRHAARIFARSWTGFADQRNFAGQQASCEWILALDADEELSPALRNSLRQWKTGPPLRDAYQFARCANYLGRWIRHSGWYPDRKTRLYRRGAGRFEGAAHDSFRMSGSPGKLRGDLLHHAFATLADHQRTVEDYSSAAAEEMFARGRRRWRASLWLATPWTFLRKVFLQAGFLDGSRGWTIARMSARYTRLKYQKLGKLVRGEPRTAASAREKTPGATGSGTTEARP